MCSSRPHFFVRPSVFDVSLSEVLKQEPVANIVRRGTSLPGNEKGRKPIELGPLPQNRRPIVSYALSVSLVLLLTAHDRPIPDQEEAWRRCPIRLAVSLSGRCLRRYTVL